MSNRERIFSVGPSDFEITWFSGKGAGGQYRNRHQNCCRLKHKETGVIGTGQSSRSQEANRKEAFLSVYNNPRFQTWLKKKVSEALYAQDESMDDIVDRAMKDILIEVKDENGRWRDEKPSRCDKYDPCRYRYAGICMYPSNAGRRPCEEYTAGTCETDEAMMPTREG